MSFIGQQLPDQSILLNITASTTGVGTVLNTTGFASLTVQLSNSNTSNLWSGIVILEGSNDNVNWTPLLVEKINELSLQTQIDTVGLYSVRSDTLFIRYNIQNITNSCNINITGNSITASSPVDKVALAMDESNNTPLNVKLQSQNSGIKQDASGAFILSDAPTAITTVQLATGGQTTIDTTGYQTIHLTTNSTFAATGGVQFSNDGITFSQVPMQTAAGLLSASLVGTTTYIIPVTGRYARIIATTAGQFTYYLRNAAAQFTGQNLIGINGTAVSATTAQLGMNVVQVGGTATVTGGLAGTLGVGSSAAVGATPTSNPLLAGAVDPTGLTRRIGSTMLGDLTISNRTIPTSNAALGSATTGNAPIATGGFNNQVSISVQDTSVYEGLSQIEILGLILQEMKIMNQQLYELPRIQAGYFNGYQTATSAPQPQPGDEPTQMRNDASLFINQQ
jgi:hypothetical protein